MRKEISLAALVGALITLVIGFVTWGLGEYLTDPEEWGRLIGLSLLALAPGGFLGAFLAIIAMAIAQNKSALAADRGRILRAMLIGGLIVPLISTIAFGETYNESNSSWTQLLSHLAWICLLGCMIGAISAMISNRLLAVIAGCISASAAFYFSIFPWFVFLGMMDTLIVQRLPFLYIGITLTVVVTGAIPALIFSRQSQLKPSV